MHHQLATRKLASAFLLATLFCSVAAFADTVERSFPKLLGLNIGEKNYQSASYQADMAKLDVVILGFYKGWRSGSAEMRGVVQALKSRNPKLKVGQYTILSEAYDNPKDTATVDIQFKLNKENWWLRDSGGAKVQWTADYGAWDINITEWTKPDFNGQRFPEWAAGRFYRTYFEPVPEFDIWYLDNVGYKQAVKRADWNMDGKDEFNDEPATQAAFRRGHVAEWTAAYKLAPNITLMGNVDHTLSTPEYQGQLGAALMEGLMGKDWSIETRLGWWAVMNHYHQVLENLKAPKIAGFNVWGKVDDYRFFRYAYTSCLMDDGYFSYTDEAKGYSSVPWFDEYDVKLGKAISPPQTKAWRGKVYRRDFENGIVLVNPGSALAKVQIEAGYKKINGKQAPLVNNGQAVTELLIPPRDGVVLVKN